MLEPDDYDLELLSRRADVPVRTIRYYIGMGLLPEAESRGRYSRYGKVHLQRLLMIRQLKDAGLSLEEIGRGLRKYREGGMLQRLQRLQRLEEIRASKREAGFPSAPSSVTGEPPAEALGYSLWAQLPADRKTDVVPQGFQARPAAAEVTWKRLPISPGVEIHVRQPLDPENDRKVAELLRQAEEIFK